MRKVIQGNNTSAPQEYVDYILIKELYHCTPSELDGQDDFITSLHVEFIAIEAKESVLQQKRAEQRANMGK